MRVIELRNTCLSIGIVPEIGGALTRFDWIAGGRTDPLFRPWSPDPNAPTGVTPDPNTLACYPLLPWSNRIGGGSFEHDGRTISVPLNRPGEPYPIHGHGWLSAWSVVHEGDDEIGLTLERTDGAPYASRARQTYALHESALTIDLAIENTGTAALPFGLGVHPFLPRDRDTRLVAPATGAWLSGADSLPHTHAPVPDDWQFAQQRALPDTLIDHAFSGWTGRATIAWPARGLRLNVSAAVPYYVLYTPPGQGFFCFEPVDHAINAVNLPGGAKRHGMTLLTPGTSLTRRFSFAVDACAPG